MKGHMLKLDYTTQLIAGGFLALLAFLTGVFGVFFVAQLAVELAEKLTR
jgi:hypothetical protein